MPTSEPSPKTIRLVTALLLLATFAAGTVTGGGLVSWFGKREHLGAPMHGAGPLPWDRLNLTEEQKEKAYQILERYRPKLDAVFGETAPKVKAITDQIDREVRAILTPEQRTRFDQDLAERGNRPPLPPSGIRPPHPGEAPRVRFDQNPPGSPPPELGRVPLPPAPASSTR